MDNLRSVLDVTKIEEIRNEHIRVLCGVKSVNENKRVCIRMV